ncbi:hypothetical protein [uncultured Ilyobacter sp.]|nr:hypothetical protein [uncultured Ilyobacter sp.]
MELFEQTKFEIEEIWVTGDARKDGKDRSNEKWLNIIVRKYKI